MKKSSVALFGFMTFFLLFAFVNRLHADETLEQQSQWFEERNAKLQRAAEYADRIIGAENKGPILASKPKRRWHLYGKTGYYYDDNVRLASDKKQFRRNGHKDQNAGRYLISAGASYEIFRNSKYLVDLGYVFSQTFHDDSLDDFNFRNHHLTLRGRRALTAWGRPAEIQLQYLFDHGELDDSTYSSSNAWYGHWKGEWAQNWELKVYEYIGAKDFRHEGYRASNSSRDGLYHNTGIVQTYYFSGRQRKIYAGYEFGFDATKGNDWDNISNAFLAGFETPLIEKVTLKNEFVVEDKNYHHFSFEPHRHDVKFQYEVRLSRPLWRYMRVSTFYRFTKSNNLNDGQLGLFNYHRNLYGVELTFNY